MCSFTSSFLGMTYQVQLKMPIFIDTEASLLTLASKRSCPTPFEFIHLTNICPMSTMYKGYNVEQDKQGP